MRKWSVSLAFALGNPNQDFVFREGLGRKTCTVHAENYVRALAMAQEAVNVPLSQIVDAVAVEITERG